MKDRVPRYPGRIMLRPVTNVPDTYTMYRQDAPTEEGTPINKATLLRDDTAGLLDLGTDGTPDMMFKALYERTLKLHLVEITFDANFIGETITITQGEDTVYTGTVPKSFKKIVGLATANTTYRITCGDTYRDITTGPYYGMQTIAIRSIYPDLEDNSWDQIAQAASAGDASDYWQVGDTKDITLSTGETLTAQIWDFAHDDLDGGGKAPITFGLKNLMQDTSRVAGQDEDWSDCIMRTKLEAIFAQLPEDLKSVIKPVIKKTYRPGSSYDTISTVDKLWLMSGVESAYLSSSEEGYPYPIFTDAASRIKRLSNGDGSVEDYWLRTPNRSYTNRWMYISTGGNYTTSTDLSVSKGICFGFCI